MGSIISTREFLRYLASLSGFNGCVLTGASPFPLVQTVRRIPGRLTPVSFRRGLLAPCLPL